jgi:hypothetical protein
MTSVEARSAKSDRLQAGNESISLAVSTDEGRKYRKTKYAE